MCHKFQTGDFGHPNIFRIHRTLVQIVNLLKILLDPRLTTLIAPK